MNLHTYFGLCADHDWNFAHTQNAERYQKGITESMELMKIYSGNNDFNGYRDIFDAWKSYIDDGGTVPNYDDFVKKS